MSKPVIWSRDALDEMKTILRRIAKDDEKAARSVVARIRETGDRLGVRAIGRNGRVAGTYEKPVTGLPYIIAYEIGPAGGGEAICILRVIHMARDWKPGKWPPA